jgi:hypothetical protein
MQHEFSDHQVTAWGGMQEMKMLIDKTGISEKLKDLNGSTTFSGEYVYLINGIVINLFSIFPFKFVRSV